MTPWAYDHFIWTRKDGYTVRYERYTPGAMASWAWFAYHPDGTPVFVKHDPEKIKRPARRKWWSEDRARAVVDNEFPLFSPGDRPVITRTTTVVNVNRQVVDKNTKWGQNAPPIRVQKGKSGKAEYGHEVAVLDAQGNEVARFIYRPDGALVACGARLVLVAHHGARVVTESVDRPQGAV